MYRVKTQPLCIEEQLSFDFNTPILHVPKRKPRYEPYLAWQYYILKDIYQKIKCYFGVSDNEIRWRYNNTLGMHFFNDDYAPTFFIPSKRISIDIFPTSPTQFTLSMQNELRVNEDVTCFNFNFYHLKRNPFEVSMLFSKLSRKEKLRNNLLKSL